MRQQMKILREAIEILAIHLTRAALIISQGFLEEIKETGIPNKPSSKSKSSILVK
jgi:hypothetical protein